MKQKRAMGGFFAWKLFYSFVLLYILVFVHATQEFLEFFGSFYFNTKMSVKKIFFIPLNPINLRYQCSIINFCKFAIIFKIPNNANSKRKYK